MDLGEKIGETALGLVNNENVQNKAVDLLGLLFPYMGIRKKAVDLYIKEIENSDLSTESKMILLLNARKELKKLKNQENIAEIANANAREGTDFSEKSGVSEEWFDRFMDSASFVSSQEMQLIWGKILANEFETPGCNPPNMIRILSEFTPACAKAFSILCSMRILIVSIDKDGEIESKDWQNVIAFNENKDYMRNVGLSFEVMNELETLGVIKFNTLGGYALAGMENKNILVYVNGNVIEISLDSKGNLPIGNVIFTSAGEALSSITEPCTVEGYEETVQKLLKSNNVSVMDQSSYNVFIEEDEIKVDKKNSYQ